MNIHSFVTPPASKTKHPAKTGDAASRDSVSSMSREAGSDKRRDAGSDKHREAGSDKRRDAGSDKHRDAGSDMRRDAGSDKHREAGSDMRRDAGSDKHREAGSDKRRDGVSDKREAIMTAALDLFVERGFYGTAVPEIAEKAGVGAGTIYRYFESKEALVNALYRQEKERFGQLTIQNFPSGNVIARELFRAMWMKMAKFAIENPKPFVFMELHHHAPYLDAQSHALEARMNALFAGVVVAAQARGELKAGPPQLLMSLVMGGFVGVIRGCLETAAKLEDANWAFAEQCMWEAIRA